MLEHLSGSSMNAYDTDIHSFYTRYVLGEEPVYCENVRNAMEFGKEYELSLGKKLWDKWDTQKIVEENIWGFVMYWLLDFHNPDTKQIIECKTKSWEWKEKDIHSSWQFRFYNWWCKERWYQFILHQYNKKTWVVKEDVINWVDDTFIPDFIDKAKQIQRFLKQFNIELKYDIQESK